MTIIFFIETCFVIACGISLAIILVNGLLSAIANNFSKRGIAELDVPNPRTVYAELAFCWITITATVILSLIKAFC